MVRQAGPVESVKVETAKKPRTTRKKPTSAKMAETGDAAKNTTAKPAAKNTPERTKQVKQETLLTDVTAAIVDRIKTHSSDWAKMGVGQQADIRREARDTANHLIKSCLTIVAGNGSPAIKAVLGEVKKHQKGHIEGRFSMSGKDEQRGLVYDHGGGGEVYLVIQQTERFTEDGEGQERLI